MTTHRGRMSENEKVIWMCVLFPIFWPFLPALLICMACEPISDAFQRWRWRRQMKGRCLKCGWPLAPSQTSFGCEPNNCAFPPPQRATDSE